MKILRSVTRRGYTVATAGWFTTTSPNRWFPASKFPDGVGQSKETAAAARAAAKTPRGADEQAPQIMLPSTHDRRPMRFALVALLAAAVAILILWWFFHIAVGLQG
jgi:hypothetical protein